MQSQNGVGGVWMGQRNSSPSFLSALFSKEFLAYCPCVRNLANQMPCWI